MAASHETKLFLDESGEFSCQSSSAYRHFGVTILSVKRTHAKETAKRFKRQTAKLVRAGWDANEEVKASALYKNRRFGEEAVKRMIAYLAGIPTLQASCIVVRKAGITFSSFRNAPYGIRYNFLAGVLLCELVFDARLRDIHLTHDLRNKETHAKRQFKEYLQTKLLDKSVELSTDFSCTYRRPGIHGLLWLGSSGFLLVGSLSEIRAQRQPFHGLVHRPHSAQTKVVYEVRARSVTLGTTATHAAYAGVGVGTSFLAFTAKTI